jgi:hypothetical protein
VLTVTAADPVHGKSRSGAVAEPDLRRCRATAVAARNARSQSLAEMIGPQLLRHLLELDPHAPVYELHDESALLLRGEHTEFRTEPTCKTAGTRYDDQILVATNRHAVVTGAREKRVHSRVQVQG